MKPLDIKLNYWFEFVRYPVGAVVEVTAIQGVKLIVRERKEES